MVVERPQLWDREFLSELVSSAASASNRQKIHAQAPRMVLTLTLQRYSDLVQVAKTARQMEDSSDRFLSVADYLENEYRRVPPVPDWLDRELLEEYLRTDHESELIRTQVVHWVIQQTLDTYGDETTLLGTVNLLRRCAAVLKSEATHLRDEFPQWLQRRMQQLGILGPPSGEVEQST